ncbi:PAS domain-containing sensor histidine kinase [Hymenobacter sp. HSC-4F20]|uniref:sensor histidine kinase n=1 Tax=Hymenobacter sp. HSC-4F20 TaxID=2864135 RepID=UPI002175971E|nr:PAS domain-containing sensor histidine kinase [Hymenobacter sp. HSC-4F20]
MISVPAEEFLPALLDLSVSGVVCYDPLTNAAGEIVDFAFAYVNPVARRLLGVPTHPATTYLQQFPDTLTNGAFAFHLNAYQSEQPAYFDLNYQGGGYDTYCRVAGRRLGHQLLVSFSFSQEQDRSQVEQTLRESRAREQAARAQAELERARLERLFMHAPAAICILSGPELVYELVNPIYQQFFPERQLVGKPLREALPELADHAAYYTMREVFDTGVTKWQQALHVPLARTDNGGLEDRYFNYVQQARYDEQGRIDGVLVFGFEVTEQVRARQSVEASAQQLRLLTDTLPVLIGYLDRERRYQFTNEAYRAWFNQDPAALLGRPVREVVGEKAYAATSGYMDRALAGERLDFEAQMPDREGFTKYIRTSYVPDVRDGEVVGFYTLVNDITEQVEARQQVQLLNEELAGINAELVAANAELHNMNTQLTRTNVDLDTFVYTASHDLKAPIINIEGILQALQEHLPPEVQQDELVGQLLGLLHDTVARFQVTISHLTDLSKLQLAHAAPAEPVLLALVIEDVRLDLASDLHAAAAQLIVEVAPDLQVSFAPQNLRSIVYNLLSNAVKYRSPDRASVVQVSAEQTLQGVVLTVQDNGLGLSEMHQRQIFGLFQRLHTHVEGTGVGLYLVKRLVENAGGTISVHSEVGVGSAFRVSFPA